jgi:hypothetical protein
LGTSAVPERKGRALYEAVRDPRECVRVIRANRDLIAGVKVRVGRNAGGASGVAPLDIALEVAEETGLPVMAHLDNPPRAGSKCAVLITTLRRLVDFHQVESFKSPADTPAMPGMLRKSTAFVPRYQKFESISLQRRVCEPSVPRWGGSARTPLQTHPQEWGPALADRGLNRRLSILASESDLPGAGRSRRRRALRKLAEQRRMCRI